MHAGLWSEQVQYSCNSQQASNQAVPEHSFTVYADNLHYTHLTGIGSGHRQLIAVPCIAEHA